MLEATRRYLAQERKSTAIVLSNLALADIRQGRIDAATVCLHEAIDVVERNRSGGGLKLVFAAVRELRPWRNESMVDDVTDRLLTLMTTA